VIEMEIAVDGERLPSCVGDGLIVCTPTGSTAYNLSAGGPILAGSMEAMVITPLCPHSLSFRPIVIDAASVVEIRCTRINEGTTVSVDGQVATKLALGEVPNVAAERSSFRWSKPVQDPLGHAGDQARLGQSPGTPSN
jgi:NAD kinase